MAVDPRACGGDPAFDLIDWVLLDEGDEQTWFRRVGRLADEVGADPASLWRWCGSTAVLIAISQIVRGNGSTGYIRSLLALAARDTYPDEDA